MDKIVVNSDGNEITFEADSFYANPEDNNLYIWNGEGLVAVFSTWESACFFDSIVDNEDEE